MEKNKKIIRILSVIILACVLAGNSVFPAYAVDTENAVPGNVSDAPAYVPDELLIMYKDDITDAQAEEMVEEQGDEGIEVISKIEEGTIAVVSISDSTSVEDALKEYEADDRVVSVMPNYELELFDGPSVNDSSYSEQWYLQQMDVPGAWDVINKTPHSKVKVVVLDTGIDINHPDLKNVLNIQESKEILNADGSMGPLQGDGYKSGVYAPGNSHGTHVSGIIAAQANNGQGIAGVGSALDNSVIDLVSVDVFSEDRTTDVAYLIKGLEYAKNIGAKVINLSLGANQSGSWDYDSVLKSRCDDLAAQGIILVCAAGNNNSSDNGKVTVVPSDYDSAISVISLDNSNQKEKDSNYGSLKDISAPGVNIYSTVKDGHYGLMSGTSMAAPGVTGIVAMMCSLKPDIRIDEVRSILRDTAVDIGTPGYDIYTGAGLIDAKGAVETVAYGNGGATDGVTLPYRDVSGKAWYYDAAAYMYKKGIMTGLEPTVFGAEGKVSRAQFATIMYRMAGEEKAAYSSKFPDVSKGQFYTDAVTWAASKGIIKGYENGRFGPSDLITREQMAVLLYRYVQYLKYDVSNKSNLEHFTDARSVSGFALEAMQWANAEDIIRGNPDATLAPRAYADRASCAAMIMRFMKDYQGVE
ncbi:MAG: S8 family serine peptidase [Muricomes sp.]